MTSPRQLKPDWDDGDWRKAFAKIEVLPWWWPEWAIDWSPGEPLEPVGADAAGEALGPDDWRYAVLWAQAGKVHIRGMSIAMYSQAIALAGRNIRNRIKPRLTYQQMIAELSQDKSWSVDDSP